MGLFFDFSYKYYPSRSTKYIFWKSLKRMDQIQSKLVMLKRERTSQNKMLLLYKIKNFCMNFCIFIPRFFLGLIIVHTQPIFRN